MTSTAAPVQCYRCHVTLTDEHGWRASDAARWHSYAAESRDCCRKCARELENAATDAIQAEKAHWPSPEYGRIRYLLLDRGWKPSDKKWAFYTAGGRWMLDWTDGKWVLGEAPDYDDVVERETGEDIADLLAALREWEVRS